MRYFLVLFFLSACAFDSSLKDIPAWYVSAKENDEQNFYGFGIGSTKQESVTYALKNMASKISVSISSETTLVSEEKDLKLYEETRESTREVVPYISFNNYKVINVKRVDGKFYSEVSVNKNDFLNTQKQIYLGLQERLKKLKEDFFLAVSPIERHRIVVEISKMNSELRVLNQMLRSFNKITEIEFSKSIQQQKIYQGFCDNFINKSEIYVNFKNTPEQIQEAVWSALSEEKKLKISKERNSKNPYLIKLNFDSKITASNVYGNHVLFLRVKTRVLSTENKEFSNSVFDLEVSSKKDKDDAINNASNQIAKLMKENGALKTLGISW